MHTHTNIWIYRKAHTNDNFIHTYTNIIQDETLDVLFHLYTRIFSSLDKSVVKPGPFPLWPLWFWCILAAVAHIPPTHEPCGWASVELRWPNRNGRWLRYGLHHWEKKGRTLPRWPAWDGRGGCGCRLESDTTFPTSLNVDSIANVILDHCEPHHDRQI